jgi:hypothetical protein
MTEKYKKIFERVILGTAAFWFLAFLADILIPWLLDVLRHSDDLAPFSEYGGIVTTIAAIVCFVTIAIALIVCLVKSKKEKKN